MTSAAYARLHTAEGVGPAGWRSVRAKLNNASQPFDGPGGERFRHEELSGRHTVRTM